jgi:hypothetical protein
MVNQKRIEKKLPELLSDGSLKERENWNKYQVTRYKLSKLKTQNPSKLQNIIVNLAKSLEQLERDLQNSEWEFGKKKRK